MLVIFASDQICGIEGATALGGKQYECDDISTARCAKRVCA